MFNEGKLSEDDKILDGWTGGFLGSIMRFWLGSYITYRMGARFPFGTFAINISGSFLIGFIVTLLGEHAHWSPNLLYFIPIGFIGAYTTFSTFELEAFPQCSNR